MSRIAIILAALAAMLGAPPADLERHIDYIHYNPVKHALVTRVADWPHSSFHRFVAQGILPADWAGDASELSDRFGE